jgi:hypothetical protein
MTRESPLADLLPVWRTLREDDVTALVTPSLDYVGALELGTLDVRFCGPEQEAAIGEGLRSLFASLDDDTTLQFLFRVDTQIESVVREYEAICRGAEPAALRAYVAARARWLRSRPIRSCRAFLFVSERPAASTYRGQIGLPIPFSRAAERGSEAAHRSALRRLAQLRDRIAARLRQLGVPSRELNAGELRQVLFDLLNPGRARAAAAAPAGAPREQLWSTRTVRTLGRHVQELTEAEMLCFENVEDGRRSFRHGPILRRAATLKVLPESGTAYFGASQLLQLATRGADGHAVPFPYTVGVTVHVKHQGRARWLLDRQHSLAGILAHALPFLRAESVEQDEADHAKRASVRGLFAELHALSTKIADLSVTVLLEGNDAEQLDERTEAARDAFARAGNSEMLVEDVAQVPAFLSLLPGAGPFQLRRKGCTTRNAADFAPLFAPWNGTDRAASVLLTPSGDFFRLDLADRKLSTAHHGLVVADTGSGKSFALATLFLDGLASGHEAILIDSGASWEPLTTLLGGVHLPIDVRTSISPFVPYPEMLDDEGRLSNEELHDVVAFLQVCVTEPGAPGLDKVAFDAVARAVRWCYETRFQDRPAARPLLGDFRAALREFPWEHADDRAIAEGVHRRLGPFTEGLYADFVNRPSSLRFDARLLTFDLQRVSQDPVLKQLAVACVVQAVTNRAAQRHAHTIVAVDEGHEHLGQDDAGERFLASCYRKMRKHDVSMWIVSQTLRDFTSAKAGPAIVRNSAIKILLRHGSGHEEVAQYLGLSPAALEAFRRLEMSPGRHSDFLLLYGAQVTTVRLAPHPLAYWICTTDPADKAVLARAQARNPSLPRLQLLEELAWRYPHGAANPVQRSRRRVGEEAR